MIRTLFLIHLFAVSAIRVNAQTVSTCRASDAGAQEMLSFVRELVTSTSSERVQLRNYLGLRAMDSTKVQLVSDNQTCAKVAAGLNTRLATPSLVRQLYVVKVGTDFAAKDPGNPAGEWWPTVTLDNRYRFKAAVLVP